MSDVNRLQAAETVTITDGTAVVGVLGTQPAGTEYGIVVREAQRGPAAMSASRPVTLALDQPPIDVLRYEQGYANYAASVSVTIASVPLSSTTSLAYLWHPASVTKRYELVKIAMSFGGSTGTDTVVRVCRITGENATPAGTLLTPLAFDGADPASVAVVRQQATGNPTRAAADVVVRQVAGTSLPTGFEIKFDNSKPLICRAGQAEGWEIRLVNNVATAITNLRFTIDLIWLEY